MGEAKGVPLRKPCRGGHRAAVGGGIGQKPVVGKENQKKTMILGLPMASPLVLGKGIGPL